MSGNRKLQEEVLAISEGVLETVVDLSLYLAFWGFDIVYGTSPAAKGKPLFRDSDWKLEALEQINYQTIKKAINRARKRGWIKEAGQGKRVNPEITKAGIKRLNAKLPFYDEKRTWDKRLYLVTYDIPEDRKNDREILREKLLKIGCGMLQKSVWITPYNPSEVLEEFIHKRKLNGAVIISSVGEGGSIGKESIKELVNKVYKLDKLNKRYRKFLATYKDKNRDLINWMFAYLSILQDDPQLPFELLPNDWVGDRAYGVFKSLVKQVAKTTKPSLF